VVAWVEAEGWAVGEEEKAAVGWAASGSGELGSEVGLEAADLAVAGSGEADLEAEGSEAGSEEAS